MLVVSLRQAGGVEFIDVASGVSLGTARSSAAGSHGVALSPDSRFAFVSVEGAEGEPGRVDIWDLRTLSRVASVEVGEGAAGIAFWKMEGAAAARR
jgi:DNA-binding beta-propeller fold protein YncE